MKNLFTVGVFALVLSISQRAFSAVFYSQNIPSQNFSDITNWNTLPNGTGSQPVLADFKTAILFS
jgi:hypothetical protein